MKRTALFAILASTTLVAAPLAAEPLDISEVEVVTDLEAVDANALDRWPEIAADLTVAITSGLDELMEEDGRYSVSVDVTEISNAGATMLGEDGEFNRIEGWAYVNGPGSDMPLEKLKIELEAEEGVALVPADVTIKAPERESFYDALVAGFAYEVSSDVSELQTEWLKPDQAEDNS
nr:hypothetical protein [uncultured Celeribacter sp.]